MFIQKKDMDAVLPGAYDLIPPQIRDRLADITATERSTDVLRKGFSFLQSYLDGLFAKLQYTDGARWPLWKVIAAFYSVEAQVGERALFKVGKQIYSTMVWPPHITTLETALRSMDVAYRHAHDDAPPEVLGGWVCLDDSPGHYVVEDRTPYPASFSHGIVAGICEAFSAQRGRVTVADTNGRRFAVDYAGK